MYEYVCEHIIPGCTFTEKDESREKLMERVEVHLKEKHDLDRHDDRIAQALKTTGISFIRPV
ncbi:MAG: DUF1059 domain-containing protein [Acidimicrobiia bacterium]